MNTSDLQAIIDKVKAGEDLTVEEELVYLTQVMKMDEDEANRLITITENKDRNTLID
jgi:hypothetical protein